MKYIYELMGLVVFLGIVYYVAKQTGTMDKIKEKFGQRPPKDGDDLPGK